MALENQFINVRPGDVGIVGDPIDHSLSPIMQNAAFIEGNVDTTFIERTWMQPKS